MPQGLSYSDAVKLLGGSGPLVRIADNLLGGALTLATAGGSDAALSLFDAKAEAIRLGHVVGSRITEVVRGNSRYNRNQRLQAAHGVLVVTAFFEALDTCLDAAGLATSGLGRDEQTRLTAAAGEKSDWPGRLVRGALPAPGPGVPYDDLLGQLHAWFAEMTARTATHLGADPTGYLVDRVPDIAVARYEEHLRKLTEEVPEFALWMRQQEDRAATRGLETLEATLRQVTSHRDPARHRQALALTYRADLGQPILGGDAGDLVMPALGRGYLDPRYRVKPAGPGARPADEAWWDTEPRDDLGGFLATYLTTPQAADAPLLLLGQPGAGKSTLTKALAGRLPAADFLVVRVPLRDVRAEADVQDQVEQALRATIGETVAWPELARDADAAMPVILLDGFDELLQATGIHQSDYLQRVAAFQQREATLGRPVAVMVTSRIAVADRARVPSGSLIVRLEAFDETQQAHWLDIWTSANADRWTETRRPLRVATLRRFPELAEQPLLLLMLALYDATGNALQDAGESFDTGQLYERLLHEFAAREVHRVHGDQPDRALPALVEQELLRLSVVAFAMFHRLRLWVTTEELDADLAGLELAADRGPRTQAFKAPISAGQEMVGRFFFIQRAQAVQEDQTRQTYEFLHATFGEYLVARLVVRGLVNAAARSRAETLHLGPAEDDKLLRSLLGYTPLCARNTVLPFVGELLLRRPDVADIREWIVERLRVAVTRPGYTPLTYQPIDKRVDHWMATYSFNLAMLALACGPPLRASELFRHAKDPAGWLRDTSLQWRAAVPGGMFLDALERVNISRTWADDGRRDLVLAKTDVRVRQEVDMAWSHGFGPRWRIGDDSTSDEINQYFPLNEALRSMDLSSAFSDDVLRHALDPLLNRWPEQLVNFVSHGPQDHESVAHSLIRLLLVSAWGADPQTLLRAYERFGLAIEAARVVEFIDVFDRLLAADAPRLPAAEVDALRRRRTFF